MVHLPDVRVWHGQGQTAKQMSADARIEYWRSRAEYFAKNFGPGTCVVADIGLRLRLLLNWLASGLCAGATLGASERWRDKWRVYSALLAWHARGRPREAGLPR